MCITVTFCDVSFQADVEADVEDSTVPVDAGLEGDKEEEIAEETETKDEPADEAANDENDDGGDGANDEPNVEDGNEGEENTEEEQPAAVDDQPSDDPVEDGNKDAQEDDDVPVDPATEETSKDTELAESEEKAVTTPPPAEEDDDKGDDQGDEQGDKQGDDKGDDDTVVDNSVQENNRADVPVMSDEEKAKCRRLFDKKAVNERLDLVGLKAVFRLMGQVISSSDADQIFDEADKDDDGTVDFKEFCRLYSKFGQEEEVRRSLLTDSVKKLFKSNSRGEMELSQVEQVLLKLQQPGPNSKLLREKSDLRPEDIRSLIKTMDKDGNGRIAEKEFVETLCQHLEC
ncbi:RNA polymerase-associated protein LEO1 [Biomphalaria glabrata]|nr:RNA polymerase-associated protein LEO1-like [Biomphalaria glabrata]KAI8764509.1 RNA polymerase-associated protein LEO1 [Biomphalaria glabrata]